MKNWQDALAEFLWNILKGRVEALIKSTVDEAITRLRTAIEKEIRDIAGDVEDLAEGVVNLAEGEVRDAASDAGKLLGKLVGKRFGG